MSIHGRDIERAEHKNYIKKYQHSVCFSASWDMTCTASRRLLWVQSSMHAPRWPRQDGVCQWLRSLCRSCHDVRAKDSIGYISVDNHGDFWGLHIGLHAGLFRWSRGVWDNSRTFHTFTALPRMLSNFTLKPESSQVRLWNNQWSPSRPHIQ